MPLRVVFECKEQIPIRDRVEEFYQQRIRNRSVYVANGRHYFVTNEVPPAKMLEPIAAPFLRSTGAGIRTLSAPYCGRQRRWLGVDPLGF
jgi:hypothetical protein